MFLPTLCLLCGNDRPSDPLALCPTCGRAPPVVRWTRDARSASWLFGRTLVLIGALAISCIFALTCFALSYEWAYESLFGRLLQAVVWVLVVPISALMALMCPLMAFEELAARKTSWSDESRTLRGSVTTLFGRVRTAKGGVTRSALPSSIQGAPISAQSVLHPNLRGIRKALCSRTGTTWRNQELLVLSALLGMIDRNELTLGFQVDRSWARDGDKVRSGIAGPPLPEVFATGLSLPAGWLERRLFDALPRLQARGDSEARTPALSTPFRAAAQDPLAGQSAPVALDECVRRALRDLPDLKRGLIERVRDDRAAYRTLDMAEAIEMILTSLRSDPAVVFSVTAQIKQGVKGR